MSPRALPTLHARSCGCGMTRRSEPCQRLDGKWPGIAEAVRDMVLVGELDAEAFPAVAEACGVAQFPTLKVVAMALPAPAWPC